MSRINVENIRHPDAASDSLQLSDTGNITAPGNLSVTGTSTLTDDLVVDTDTLFVDASTDRVGIGTTSPDTAVTVSEANVAVTSSSSNVNIYANDALAADIGGSIGLGATWNGTGGLINYGSIHGKKANSTSGNTDGYMSFVVRDNGGTKERLRILSDGSLRLLNSTGIDFSQIQTNATGMTSETLDSYEEGTFTPSFTSGTSGSGYTRQVGEYTKIGRLVTFTLTIDGDGGLTGTATAIEIGGLPFTSRNVAEIGGAQVTYPGDFDTTNDRRFWLVAQNNTTLSYRSATAAQINGNLVNNINSQLNLCGYYFTDA